MQKRRKVLSIITGFLIVIQCFFGSVSAPLFDDLSFTASAAFEGAVDVTSSGIMDISASIKINGQELTEDMNVRNGDSLSLDFSWVLTTDHEYVNGVFVYDLADKLHGLTLDEQVILVGSIAQYTVQGDKLYIELFTGSSGREGSCSLDGEIALDELDDSEFNDDGEFIFEYFDNSITLRAPEKVPGLWVAKDNDGSVYEKDGEYYQNFKVSVGNNSAVATNVSVTDQFPDVYTEISNVKVDGNAAVYSTDGSSFSVNVGDINAGWENQKVLTYTLKLDKEKVIANNLSWEEKTNKATAVIDNDPDTAKTDDAQYWADLGQTWKSGSYDSATNTITWTIYVKPNLLGDADFSVKDVPSSVISDAVASALGADMSISKSEMTLNGDVYEYTYQTAVPDSITSSPTPTSISNHIDTTFDTTPTYTVSGDCGVTIPGQYTDFVTKTASDPVDGVITWTINVKVPDVDNLESLKISDTVSDGGKGTIDSGKLKLDETSFKVMANGSTYQVATVGNSNVIAKVVDGAATEVVGTVGWVDGKSYAEFTLIEGEISTYDSSWVETKHTSDILSQLRGQTITVTCQTTMTSDVNYCSNNAKADFVIAGNTVSDNDSAEYVKDMEASKKPYNAAFYDDYDVSGAIHQLNWQVGVSSQSFEVGDVITIVDTIPSGYEYLAGSAVLAPYATDWGVWHENSYKDQLTESVSGQKVTFTVTVNQAVLDMLATKGVYTISVVYRTGMTNSEHAVFVKNNVSKTYTNSASVKVNSIDAGTVSASQTIYPNKANVIEKTVISQGKDNSDNKFYATYQIKINSEAVALYDGATYSVDDVLGTRLSLVDGSVTIYPNESGESYTYNEGTNTITFSDLKDATAYTFTYKTAVGQIYKNETVTDDAIVEMFGNAVSIQMDSSTSISSNVSLNESTYRSQGEYIYDEKVGSISISGTKVWVEDSKNVVGTPKSITITLKTTEIPVSGTSSVTTQEFVVSAPTDSSGNWSYTISDLITKKTDGTTYEYEITEVKVDGFKTTYSTENEGITSSIIDAEYPLNITNTFNATEEEYGSLRVDKVWANDTLDDRMDVKITLADSTGNYVYTKTLTTSESFVEFDNLPLYTYSRDASGELVRELRTYTLTETVANASDAADFSEYSVTLPAEFTIVDSVLAAGEAATAQTVKTITNTHSDTEIFGTIVIKKTYSDILTLTSENAALLAATEFTLYTDYTCTNAIATAKPVLTDSEAVATFTNIPEGTYCIMETAGPADYTLSSKKIVASITSSGAALYNDNDNTISNERIYTPGDIEIEKTYSDIASLSASNSALLSATEFTLYTDSACTNAVATVSPALSGNKAVATFESGLSLNTTYYIKETAGPDGYTISDTVLTAVIDAQGNVTYPSGSVISNEKIYTPNAIEVEKLYSDIASLSASNSALLSSTSITIYKDSACTNALETVSPELSGNKAVATFDSGLSLNTTYYIKETAAPANYTISDTVVVATIDAYGNVTFTAGNKIENQRVYTPGSIEIEKTYSDISSLTSENASLLASTSITLYSDSACTNAIATVNPVLSGNKAVATFSSGLSLNTTYYIKETVAPADYTVSSTVITAVIDAFGGVTYSSGNKITNQRIYTPGEIKVEKVYSDITTLTDENAATLAGTVLTLYSDSAYTNVVATTSPVLVDGKAIATFSSELLELDTHFYIRETTAPDGYTISATVITVMIDAYGTVTYTYGDTITNTAVVTDPDEPSGDDPSGDDPSGDDPSGDDPSGDDPSGDDPSGDDPSVDDPSGDDPSGDDPSGDDPSGDDPSGDDPSGDDPSGDDPSGDDPSGDDPSGDDPSGDDPSGDDPSGDDPSGDDPSGDDPSGDDPSGDDPSGDDPSGDDPSGDDPSGDDPSGDDPSGDDPSGDDPSGDDPSGDDPSGDDPSGDDPSGDDPSGDDPSGDDPSDDDPSGDDPSGDDPSGDDPSGDDPSGDDPSGDDPSGDDPSGDDPSGDDPTPDTPIIIVPSNPDPSDPDDPIIIVPSDPDDPSDPENPDDPTGDIIVDPDKPNDPMPDDTTGDEENPVMSDSSIAVMLFMLSLSAAAAFVAFRKRKSN